MAVTDVELTISRRSSGATFVALRVELPYQRVDPVRGLPITLADDVLRALINQPDVYGAALTAMIFLPALREAWREARGYADGQRQALRVRLALEGDDDLHTIRWELLRDPVDGTPLAHHERQRLVRFLPTASYDSLQLPARPDLHAVVAVASPPTRTLDMHVIDVQAEVLRAQQGLGDIQTTVFDGRDGRPRATLAAIAAALRTGAHILYLVSHGALVEGQPYLWLDQEVEGAYRPCNGSELVQSIATLARRPLLVVLAACQGAGDSYEILAAVGPALAYTGVGAVIAMQGDAPVDLVAQLTPRLFTELRRDGQIDRALAAARAALPVNTPWWMPVLWMSARDGALWRTVGEDERIPRATVFHVPHHLNPLFCGRDDELATLRRMLLSEDDAATSMLPALVGVGGVGKTQLASAFAHRMRAAFLGGVFWIVMEHADEIASQVAAIGGPGGLDLPGWAAMSFDDRVAAVRRTWEEPVRRLIVFDNLEDPTLISRWRPRGGESRVLITSRRGVWAATSGVHSIRLGPLARAESMRLLLAPRATSLGQDVDILLADATAAQQADAICEQVGDLPLALALAGAYLEQAPSLSLDGYRRMLETSLLTHPSLDATLEEGLPTGHVASISATIAVSYDQLNSATLTDRLSRTLLRRAARLAPAPLPPRLLVRLTGRDPDDEVQAAEVDIALRRLTATGLLESVAERHGLIHRLVAAFVCGQEATDGADTVAISAALLAEVRSLTQQEYARQAVDYIPHHAHWVNRSPVDATAINLLNQLGYLVWSYGDRQTAPAYFARAVVMSEQLYGPQHVETAVCLSELSSAEWGMGQPVAAQHTVERALAIFAQSPEPTHPVVISCLNILSGVLEVQGQLADALVAGKQALALAQTICGPMHTRTARSALRVGSLYWQHGDVALARQYMEQALHIWETILGSQHSYTASCLDRLGSLLLAQGWANEAQPYLERGLAARMHSLGPNHLDTASSLESMGWLMDEQGDPEAAQGYRQQALAIYEVRLGSDHERTKRVRVQLD